MFGRIAAPQIAPVGVVGIGADDQQIGALASLQWPTPAGTTTTSPALTSSTCAARTAEQHLGRSRSPRPAPRARRCGSGGTDAPHRATRPASGCAVKMRSIAAGSAGTAWRYTSSGSFEFGMAPSSAKVKVWVRSFVTRLRLQNFGLRPPTANQVGAGTASTASSASSSSP